MSLLFKIYLFLTIPSTLIQAHIVYWHYHSASSYLISPC